MKKTLTLLAFLYAFSPLYAQTFPSFPENTACTAICLDTSGIVKGRMPKQDGIAPNIHLPCDVTTTNEHNPTWWYFRPTTNTFSISYTTTNCVAGQCGFGVQLTLWEGDDCNNIHGVTCDQDINGIITAFVNPCKIYYIQLDGVCECQCNVFLFYDKKSIMSPYTIPSLDVKTKVCLGSEVKLNASTLGTSCHPYAYSWITRPQGMAQVTPSANEINAANLVVNTIPPNGKISVCIKPVEYGICAIAAPEKCFNLEVVNNDLKPATCDVKLCPEELPFDYDLLKCIKTTNPTLTAKISPQIFNVKLPEGTKKQEKVTYAVEGTNCKGDVNLNLNIQKNPKTQLAPLLLCEKDTTIIKGSRFTPEDASPLAKIIRKTNNPNLQLCDSIFEVLVQAIKVEPKISGVATLDCSNKEIILNAGGVQTITYPNDVNYSNYKGVGKRTYQWFKNGNLLQGDTSPVLKVMTSGKYKVNLNFTYEVTMNINGKIGKWSKSCSKSTEVDIKEQLGNSIAEDPIAFNFACINGNNAYFINPDPNAQQYSWTASNATITNQITDPKGIVAVSVTNNGNPYTICLTKKACNIVSVPNCITVSPFPKLTKPTPIGQTNVCLGDTVTYQLSNVTTYKSPLVFKWQITNGTIIGKDTEPSVKVIWNNSINNGLVKLKITDMCETTDSTLNININILPPVKPTQIIGKKSLCFGTVEKYEIFQPQLSNSYSWYINGVQTYKISNDTKSIEVVWNKIGKHTICVSASNKCFTNPSDEYCFEVEVKTLLKPNAGANDTVCNKEVYLNGKVTAGGTKYAWSKIKGPGIATFTDSLKYNTIVKVSECGEYIFEFKEWLGGCEVKDSVTILFNGSPRLKYMNTNCNILNNTYDVKLEFEDCYKPITTPNSKYPVIFNPQTGIYSIKNIPNTDTLWYLFFKNTKNCSNYVDIYVNCNCSTYAGTMKLDSTIIVCSKGGKVKANHNGDQVNDGNDTFAFVLHEGDEEAIINEIARNKTGEFDFIPTKMQCGKKYYISYIIGNELNGQIDRFDNCVNVTLKGQPVLWNCQPKPTVINDLTVCGLEASLEASQLQTNESGLWKGSFSSISDPKSIKPKVFVKNSGTYKFWWIVRNGACIDSASMNVTFLELPNVKVGSNSPICEGDSLLLSSDGAIIYSWSGPNNFNSSSQNPIITNCNLSATGKYKVEGTNSSGCKNAVEINVEVNPNPVIDVTSNTPICEGETLKLTANGADKFIWTGPNNFNNNTQNPIITNCNLLATGKYKVEGTDSNACKNTAEIDVEIKVKPNATITTNSPVCEGKTAMLEAAGGIGYKWLGPDNFSSTLSNPTISNVQAKNAGLYIVEVTNIVNCKGSATTNLVVENCISSKDVTNKNVQIYPNPFTQQLNIDADDIMDKITIYNALGQTILEQNCQNNKAILDVSALPSANYNLKINWSNGKKSEYRVIKQ